MKKILLKGLLLLLVSSAAFPQNVSNNGSSIYVASGTTMTIAGDYENLQTGQFMVEGELHLHGDWINNGSTGGMSYGYNGTTVFKGSSLQRIMGSTMSEFNSLDVLSDIEMLADVSVWEELNLTGGNINLLNNDLSYQGWIGINTASGHYCIAEGEGKLRMFVDMTMPALFPVGTSTSYAPVEISLTTTSDIFAVNMDNTVLTEGTTGATIPEIEDCVNLSWHIQPDFPDFADYDLTLHWNLNDEGATFDRNHSAVGGYDTLDWVASDPSAASGSDPYSHTKSGITYAGSFAVGDMESPMAEMQGVTLDLTMFLEGPFNGSTMETGLNTAGLIPLEHPYLAAPWNYSGDEQVSIIPNTNVVDWVLIELRDATDAASANSSTSVARQAAFLLDDGSVVGLDGVSMIVANLVPQDDLFVVIWHRNHLGVLSANALTETGGVYTYDFSSGANQVYGGMIGHKELSPGVWGMVAADGNADGQVDNTDKNVIWSQQAGAAGYLSGDFNLDSQVDNTDKNVVWIPNSGSGGQVPDGALNGFECQVPK